MRKIISATKIIITVNTPKKNKKCEFLLEQAISGIEYVDNEIYNKIDLYFRFHSNTFKGIWTKFKSKWLPSNIKWWYEKIR